MPTTTVTAQTTALPEHLEQSIRARIDSLSYLPTTVAVAMKFVELGKDLDADPSDYAKVIEADSSLSSKILSLTNSSWAGVRNKVTNVKTAVNLLGLGTVRTLAISYCMTGLHNELRLTAEESDTFWEASLCKAVAAKKYAGSFNAKLADEAFVAGMFQDFALPVMYSTAKDRLMQILSDTSCSTSGQLQHERTVWRLDHADVGRILAQKLDLPEMFIDAVAFHHDAEKLNEFIQQPAIAAATHVASLFPHLINAWHKQDAERLRAFLRARTPSLEPEAFVAEVQKEFDQIYGFFHEGGSPDTQLTDLLERATREAADNTTELVGTVNELLRQAAATGMQVNQLVEEHNELAAKATCDALTGLLNRDAFMTEASELLTKAARYGFSFAVAYLDIDKFKAVNDTCGHEAGDAALKAVAGHLQEIIPERYLVARFGGDEFVVLLSDCTENDVTQLVSSLITRVADSPVRNKSRSLPISLSAGLLQVQASNQQQELDVVLGAADKLMYRAKEAGGNRIEARTISA